jgi:hypothetical protein
MNAERAGLGTERAMDGRIDEQFVHDKREGLHNKRRNQDPFSSS